MTKRPWQTMNGGVCATRMSLAIKEARVRHAGEIEAATRIINEMGGDMTIDELIALLLVRGWLPPDSVRAGSAQR